jgi:hypothetical protein
MKNMNETFKRTSIQDDFEILGSKTSDVCGIETNFSSEWMPFGGPIKGSYIV